MLHLHNAGIPARSGRRARRWPVCRCRGCNPIPDPVLNCRGSLPEAAGYAAALAVHQPHHSEERYMRELPALYERAGA